MPHGMEVELLSTIIIPQMAYLRSIIAQYQTIMLMVLVGLDMVVVIGHLIQMLLLTVAFFHLTQQIIMEGLQIFGVEVP